MDGATEVTFPNGTGVLYFDEDHSYWKRHPDGRRGRRLTGVTTAIKPIEACYQRDQNLFRWVARTNGIGIAELISEALLPEEAEEIRDSLSWARDHETIWAELERRSLTFEDVRDRAGTRGTNVHRLALEALAKGEPTPDYAGMTEEEQGYARGVVEFWLDHEPEVLQVEQIVYSEDLGIAGRMDLRAKLDGKDDPVIVDLKTGFVSEGAHVQLAGYDHLARECGIGGSAAQYLLRVKEDGSYKLIPVKATRKDFLATVDLYRRGARLRKAARG